MGKTQDLSMGSRIGRPTEGEKMKAGGGTLERIRD
jgi:hypothetical protein